MESADGEVMVKEAELEAIKLEWTNEQNKLALEVVESDSRDFGDVSLFGGLDISFIKGDEVNACACYVVLNKDLEVMYQEVSMVELAAPYIPSFLGFREAAHLAALVRRQVAARPELTPGVLMVDGNGLLHPRRCGTACHIGLATGLPTLGVAKNIHLIEELGLTGAKGEVARGLKEVFKEVKEVGGHRPLTTTEGRVLGAALKTSAASRNPVFVSVGSGLSLATALALVTATSRHRVPEAIRQADLLSREFLRRHHPDPRQVQAARQPGKTRKEKEKEGGKGGGKEGGKEGPARPDPDKKPGPSTVPLL